MLVRGRGEYVCFCDVTLANITPEMPGWMALYAGRDGIKVECSTRVSIRVIADG